MPISVRELIFEFTDLLKQQNIARILRSSLPKNMTHVESRT